MFVWPNSYKILFDNTFLYSLITENVNLIVKKQNEKKVSVPFKCDKYTEGN